MESCAGANDYRIKMGSKIKMYHLNMLKRYIARERGARGGRGAYK